MDILTADTTTAVEDELQKQLSQLDNVETARQLYSFSTSQCTTDIYSNEKSREELFHSRLTPDNEEEVSSFISSEETGDEALGDIRCSPHRQEIKKYSKKEIKKISIHRPKLWAEKQVNGGALRMRASTPTKKSIPRPIEKISRRKTISPFKRQSYSSQYSSDGQKSLPKSMLTKSDYSILVSYDSFVMPRSSKCSYTQSQELSRWASLTKLGRIHVSQNLDEDLTEHGVPSLSNASSTISDVSSVLSNNLSLGYDDHTKNNSVAVVYGEGDTQVQISFGATVEGNQLHVVALSSS
ncbi:hypothetical protein RB195_012603 [Necator americanus]|uniref:Uncharacterized protein n=1 Tax=Necator americanus TaxID=51031 RepID=A0ABR1DUE7_NECAM